MKTISLAIAALLTISLTASPETEKSLHKVNFYMPMSKGEYRMPNEIYCEHDNILKHRQARNPTEPNVVTIDLSQRTARVKEEVPICSKVWSNLTLLDQQSVRDEIGQILQSMKCEPGREINIQFGSDKRDKPPRSNWKNEWVINKVMVEGCLDPRPDSCSFPWAFAGYNPDTTLVRQDDMMKLFRRCRDAINKYVEDNGLEAKWAQEAKKKEESR